MKKGFLYAVYRGVRYPADKISVSKYLLTAKSATCPDGFHYIKPSESIYYKYVFSHELDEIYFSKSVAVHQNELYQIIDADAEHVTVLTEHSGHTETAEACSAACLPRSALTRIIEYHYVITLAPPDEAD